MRIDWILVLLRLMMVVLLALGLSAAVGCSSDDDDDGAIAEDGSKSPGTDDAGDSSDDKVCVGCSDCPPADPPFSDPYCINLKCPDIPPLDGDLVQKGACCYRIPAEVAAKEMREPGEGWPLSFAINLNLAVTQPKTIGSEPIRDIMRDSQERGWETILLRINSVIPEDEAPPGPTDVTIDLGSGRQNCDGTYSFYGPGAAPDHEGRTDANRWDMRTMTGTWDWEADPYLSINDEGRYFGLAWAPRWFDREILNEQPIINYEQPLRALDLIIPNDSRDAEGNCIGQRLDNGTWQGPPALTIFIPIQESDQTVTQIAAQTLCAIIANGVGTRDSDGESYTCEGPRVDGPNPWLELPDSMCPTDPSDETPCWIGVKSHPDFKAERDCNDSDRPCCDPTGTDQDGLEACNSWFVKAEVILASALIRTIDGDGKKWTWRDIDYPESEEFITSPDLAPPQKCRD
jgi:hypothetical protein